MPKLQVAANAARLALVSANTSQTLPSPVSPRPSFSCNLQAPSMVASPNTPRVSTKPAAPAPAAASVPKPLAPAKEVRYLVQPSLFDDAREVLRLNTRRLNGKVWSVPSSKLYPHQWAWDSAFIALGFAEFDVARGIQEIHTLLHSQWDDGRVPHIVFHQPSDEYFPSPTYYGTAGNQNSSTISQPPVWTTALYELWKKDPTAISHADWVDLARRCEKSHLWFRAQRDPLKMNCVGIAHPWESGMDNSPAWDSALARVDPGKAKPFERRDQNKVKDASSERPTDSQYNRYASLVTQIAQSPTFAASEEFFVYDPCMTALLAKAEDDLSLLAHALGLLDVSQKALARSNELMRGLEKKLWRPDLGKFVYFDAVGKVDVDVEVIGGYMPLCGPRLDESIARNLVSALETRGYLNAHCPVPSVPPAEAYYEPCKYWRGPSWVNINFLLFQNLPERFRWQLGETTMDCIEFTGGFFEYFECRTGQGLGAAQFSWTAALVLHWGKLLNSRAIALP